MPMQGTFDANQFAPKQVGAGHPVGKFPFVIGMTSIDENKEKTGGFLKVTFTTPGGEIDMRYNLWNQSDKAKEIAHGQLSALCHATGIFRLDWQNDGAALRGGKGMIDVGFQKGQEPSAENPQGGYTEVKKVYDASGNEPGKGSPQPQPQQQQQPSGGAAWPAKDAAPSGGGWQPQNNQPQQQQPQAKPEWSQGPSNNNPPWSK